MDYQEKQFAQGVIPTSFTRREGAPKERELLCGRIIDRPIRPLFPPGFYHEVQVRILLSFYPTRSFVSLIVMHLQCEEFLTYAN